jgi:hypothetical protein
VSGSVVVPAAAQLLPPDRATTWSPGVTGGVPYRTTICANVNAATYGNGSGEASAGIQAAINACPAGQVVQLSAGTFRINASHLLINKSITLRGAGPSLTTLAKTNGAVMGSGSASDAQPVVVLGPTRWPSPDENTAVALTADAVKGAFSVTVTSAAGFAAGRFVLLDEDNYNAGAFIPLPNRSGAPTSARIWATDRVVWQRHSPSAPEDDPFPSALTWFSRSGRPVNEIKEIASVSGNTVTFTTPIHITYRVSRQAQLTRYASNPHIKFAGLEDLKVTGGGDGAVRFEAAAYSWARNIDDTVWLGEGVAFDNSFRCELRDSIIHDGAWPSPGGGGYAISLARGTAEVLIENNIILKANKVMVARSSGAGSVVGYNYADDGFINYALDWQEVGINGSHMVGPHHMLFEGNESFNYDSDNTHGTSIYHTAFRNHLTGFRSSFNGLGNGRAIGLAYGSYWHSAIGNVLGLQGQMAGWIYEDPTMDPGQPAIWRLGYEGSHWDQDQDPKVPQTMIREGNYDYVSNTIHWTGAPQTLPNSLYLTSKPWFFGTWTWPWVDPVGATKLYTLPARARYLGIVPPPPVLSISGVTVPEGSGGLPVGSSAVFTVSLSDPVYQVVTVSYSTANVTATSGSDYAATSGVLTFTPFVASRTVSVPIVGDTVDEVDETFRLNLSSPVNAVLGVSQAVATIDDDDGPRVEAQPLAVPEGNSGQQTAAFNLTLSAASPQTVAVSYDTSDGTATAGSDYLATSGSLTFAPGVTSLPVNVPVNGDVLDETNETFHLNLRSAVDATIGVESSVARILDDDGAAIELHGLEHGDQQVRDLAPVGAAPASHLYIVTQPPRTSWEVVVDQASGDLGTGNGPAVDRVGNDLTTILQSSVPVGTGPARHLRWRNTGSTTLDSYVRVSSLSCGTDCGSDDVYRVRAYETTGRIPRFNQGGGQASVVILQNVTSSSITGDVHFWSGSGALLHTQPFTLNAHGAQSLILATMPQLTGLSGTITLPHNGPHGGLVGKSVAVDTLSGLAFDSLLTTRMH